MFKLIAVDKVEITTLEDNFVSMISGDNSDIITRANPVSENGVRRSVLAEHGFSSIITTTKDAKTKTVILDYGFTRDIAVRNAAQLNIDLSTVDAIALSHGHIDHHGGLPEFLTTIGKRGLPFIAHPAAFKQNRYVKNNQGGKASMPPPDKKLIKDAGYKLIETREPYLFLDQQFLFLGEIPRKTAYEKGMPNAYYEENGKEIKDPLADDTSLVMNVKGKGLVILSGCAHAGIINSVNFARNLTGSYKIHAIMGGFHLTGPAFEPTIGDTITAMIHLDPDYIIPTHCTGRKAEEAFAKTFPEKFILNMSGTRLTFAA